VYLRRSMKAQFDNVRAGFSAFYYTAYRFFMGDGLDELSAELPGILDIAERSRNVPSVGLVKLVGRVIAGLTGQMPGRWGATEAEPPGLGRGNRLVDSSYFLFRGIAHYFAADLAGAWEDLDRAPPAVLASFMRVEICFYRALTLAGRLRGDVGPERDVLLHELNTEEETLRTWAAAAPESFGYRHALVAAETATLGETWGDALALYDRAIALAQEHGALGHEALANELCARHLLGRGRAKFARVYLTDAYYAYRRWGATAKVEELLPHVLIEQSAAPREGRGAQIDALAVIRASQAISTEILLSKLVQSLMHIAIEQAGAERGTLLLMREDQLWVEAVAGSAVEGGRFVRRPLGAASPSEPPLLPRTIVEYVRRTHEKVLLADAGKDNIFSTDRYLEVQRPRSVLCLPMMRQAKLTGMLYLENGLTGGAFSPDRVAVLEVLSAQAAISIENAALYEDMEQRIADRTRDLERNQEQRIEAERKAAVARLESELAIAQRIQTSILPRRLEAPGFEIAARMVTATEVGGDYYDLQPADAGGFWMGIGDVSGHGLSAGLVMLMIQSGLSSLMQCGPEGDPAALLCMLNRMLYNNVRLRIGGDDFATLSLLRFCSDGRFTLAGAHEELVLWRAAAGRCEVLHTPGTWIGARQDIEPYTRTHSHRLAPGDVLLLYTDGITEAMTPGGEQFGLERVCALLERLRAAPVEVICDQLFAAVDAWLTAPRLDDQTAVVLRYAGAG
jgi:serine phosphatase RsbU (regulator of sigma subunit)